MERAERESEGERGREREREKEGNDNGAHSFAMFDVFYGHLLNMDEISNE